MRPRRWFKIDFGCTIIRELDERHFERGVIDDEETEAHKAITRERERYEDIYL